MTQQVEGLATKLDNLSSPPLPLMLGSEKKLSSSLRTAPHGHTGNKCFQTGELSQKNLKTPTLKLWSETRVEQPVSAS